MADLIVVYWREIPAPVIAPAGRRNQGKMERGPGVGDGPLYRLAPPGAGDGIERAGQLVRQVARGGRERRGVGGARTG